MGWNWEESGAILFLYQIIIEVSEFMHEVTKESDRAAVILGASKLDILLYQLLVKFLKPCTQNKDELFEEGEAPLSSFNAKIHLAHRLGLIEPGFARALHLIRKIM